MSSVSDRPQFAPPEYASLEPCVDISKSGRGWGFPEYTGSGVPLEEHPFKPQEEFHSVRSRCGACGSENTLCIYLHYIGGLGTGKDMTVELVCRDCGKFTVDTYID
ncbi:MAG: hypothetical protein JXA37_10655 [Chloroflexia bacterium]|nr:hypothetical protein [Chloroflexia bacterium]